MCKPSDNKDDATITAHGKEIKPQNYMKVFRALYIFQQRLDPADK